MKDRFNKINSKKHFYLDPRNDCIKENIPSNIDLAKHTQFMKGLLEIPCQSDKIISRIDNGRENKL